MAQRGINKVILVGNLGQDPEVRYMPNGNAVASLTIATSESWKDRNSGQLQEKTEWHRVVIFGKLAEIAGEYLRKGSQVYLEGKLQTRKWQDQQGQDRYTTEIMVDMNGIMQMLDKKPSNQDQGGYQQPQGGGYQQPQPNGNQGGYRPAAQNQPQQRPPNQSHMQTHNQAKQNGYAQASGGGYQQPQGRPAPPTDPNLDFDDDIPF